MRRFVLLTLIIAALLLAAGSMNARKVSTRLPKVQSKAQVVADTIPELAGAEFDSVASKIRVFGFDKPLVSKRESLFISNESEICVGSITLRIEYFQMNGTPLHVRDVNLECHLAPEVTKRFEFKSFDTQQSLCYHKSTHPKRRSYTPFDVKVTVLKITPSP